MFVFRLHQNEYSAIIAAQNLDLILGFNLYRGETGALPQMCFIYRVWGLCDQLPSPLFQPISAASRLFRSFFCLPGRSFIWPALFSLSS